MKRIIATVLAAVLLMLVFPIGALAEDPAIKVSGAGTFEHDGSSHTVTATVENAETDTYKIEYSVNGGDYTTEAPSKSDVGTYSISIKATNETNPEAAVLTKTVQLEITEPAPKAKLVLSGGGTVKYDGSAHSINVSIENGSKDDYNFAYTVNESSVESVSLTDPGSYAIKVTATPKESGETLEATATLTIEEQATLEISGEGTFEHDGSEHKITATVKDGFGTYTVNYSSDGGSTTTTEPIGVKDVGEHTIAVIASNGTNTLTGQGVIKITEKPVTPTLKAESSKFDYDGKEHSLKEATVENGTGYTIEYSIDGGSTWTEAVPKRKAVGKDTVKIRAIKSGEETLTTGDVTLEIVQKTIETITIVNCSNSCNVRKGPSSSSTKIGTAKKGNVYPYLGKEGKYYKIQYKSDAVGYVHEDYAKKGESPVDPDPEPTGKTLTIVNCNEWVNVRAGGNSSTAKIGTAPKGAKYSYLGKSGNYYKIQYTASKVGFVHKKYAKISGSDPEPSGDMVVSIVNCHTDCNVRAGASSNTALLGTAPRGKTYNYLGKSGKYYKIQYTDKTVGYVHQNYGKLVDGKVTPDPEPTGDKTGVIYNCKTMVNVREKATSSSALLGTIKKGVNVTILGYEGSWVKIKYGTGSAFVFAKYVKTK